MTTAVVFVKRALNRIGVHSELNDADPELLSIGLEQLIDVLNEYENDSINLGTDDQAVTLPAVLGDEVNERSGAKFSIECVLAYRLASVCRVDLKPQNVAEYREGDNNLRQRFYEGEVPARNKSDTFPRGQGSKLLQWRRPTFFSGDAE